MSARRSWIALFFFGGVVACAALTPLEKGTCGNGVVDRLTEDCDGFALSAGGACRPPGVIGACRADCTPTSDGKSANQCPPGWRCGRDDLCRAPSELFTSGGIVASTARRILIADVDHDGRNDIIAIGEPDALGFASMRVEFIDSNLALVKETLLDVPAKGVIAPGDLTFITAGQGVASLRGRPDRAFDLVSQSSIPSSVSGFVHRSNTNELAALTYVSGRLSLALLERGKFGRVIVALSGGPDPSIAFQKAAASDPCETFAYGDPFDFMVSTVRPCTPAGAWVRGPSSTLDLSAPIAGPLVLADVNKDKLADLLIAVSGSATYVAYNEGDGTFGSPAGSSSAELFFLPVDIGGAQSALISPPGVLAVADINGDGEPDYATKKGLYVSHTSLAIGVRYSVTANDDAWGEAVFADFNGDARIDLIAASATRPQLTFIQVGSDGLQIASIPTSAIADELAAGDLDGDLFLDLAFRQTIRDTSNLDVLYGRPGLPGPISTTLSNDGIRAILAEAAQAGSTASPTTIPKPARLVVANNAPSSAERASSVTFVQASRARQWTAPVVLAGEQSTAIAIAYENGSTFALGVTTTGGGAWHPQLFDLNSPAEPILDMSSIEDALSASDELPRAVLAFVASDGAPKDAFVLYSPTSKAGTSLIAMHDTGAGVPNWVLGAVTPFDGAVDDTTAMASEDLDGDGRPELVVLSARGLAQRHALRILWNDGQGAFDPSTASDVNESPEDVQSFTFVPISPSRPRALVYSAVYPGRLNTPVVIARVAADRTIDALPRDSGFSLPTSVASGDIDGDGLPDLAYADSNGIHVLRAVPAIQAQGVP